MPPATKEAVLTEEQRQLVGDNIGLVNGFARRWKCPSFLTEEDWKSELSVAVMRCVLTYTAEKGAFSTYAFNSMRFARQRVYEQWYSVKSTTLRSVSIFGEDGKTVFDPGVEIDPSTQLGLEDARDTIKILTTRLPGMYRRITESILDGKGFSEISREMGVSKQRVNDIYKSSIVRMKRIAASMNMESPCE